MGVGSIGLEMVHPHHQVKEREAEWHATTQFTIYHWHSQQPINKRFNNTFDLNFLSVISKWIQVTWCSHRSIHPFLPSFPVTLP
jgi:hypoxanthine phosphoribosyltransferase